MKRYPDYHQLREDFYGDLYASSRLTKDTRVDQKYDYYNADTNSKITSDRLTES